MPTISHADLKPTPFRNQNDGLNAVISNKYALDFTVYDSDKDKYVPELTRTQQSPAQDCDINVMLEKHTLTGLINGNSALPKYGDFVGAPDFQSALDIVINAERMFSSLDAKTRKYFSNDPAEYLAFVNDPANLEEGIRMGLFVPRDNGVVTSPVDRKGISEGDDTPPVPSAPAKASKSPSKANDS